MKSIVLIPRVATSALRDGTIVYTASTKELPGVVCEGETQAAAVSELIASMRHLREHLGVDAIGFTTPTVSRWQWVAYEGEREVLSFGAGMEGAAFVGKPS